MVELILHVMVVCTRMVIIDIFNFSWYYHMSFIIIIQSISLCGFLLVVNWFFELYACYTSQEK